MLGGGTRQMRREKLLKALDQASQRYKNSLAMISASTRAWPC